MFETDCPYYLTIGMTYDQYWHGDVWMVEAFRKADELRMRRKNEEYWLLGRYVYDAIGNLSPILRSFAKKGTKPVPYMKSPYKISGDDERQETEEEKAEREEQEAARAKLYMTQMFMAGQNWGKH